MFLSYFDEVKISPPERMNFFIGGVTMDETDLPLIEAEIDKIAQAFFGASPLSKETEFHGAHILHGKGACKGRQLEERIKVIKALIDILKNERIHKHMTRIDVTAHRGKYKTPRPEYSLGLMLHFEQIDQFLAERQSLGMMFGDYERDNTEESILNLSSYKKNGTDYWYGKEIKCLADTVYFAHSHHSRFIQLADVFLHLAQLRHYNDRTHYAQREILDYVDMTGMLANCVVKTWP
jgi:hypothetical protein